MNEPRIRHEKRGDKIPGFTRKQIAYSWFSFNDCFLVDPLTIMLAWKRTSKWLSHASILLTPPQIRFLVTRRLSVLEVGRLFLWQIWLLVQLLEDSYLIGAARFLVGSAIRIMNVIAASRSGRFQPLCGDYERIRIMSVTAYRMPRESSPEMIGMRCSSSS